MGPRRWGPRWSEDDRTRIIDERCGEYESEWRALHAPRIEDYLRGLDAETQCTLWLELVQLDHDLRQGRGEATTLADYRESCPDPVFWLNPSTAPIDIDGDATEGTLAPDLARGLAAEFGPAEDRLLAAWIADRDAATSDAPLDVDATIGQLTDPNGPPSTAGPPREGEAGGPDGLALARPGAAFGDYELINKLGAGGMGVVFRARQRRLSRTVALKMIKAGVLADERQVRLFRSEAEAVGALDHPHIVPVLDSGEHQGILFYSMKLVDGQDMGQCLEGYRDRPAAMARLVAAVAEAIAHAHQRGVLHRDIKPSNILIDAGGEPHVIDFGLALRLDAAAVESTTGNPMGTPGYMSPEQARGRREAITTATDVYGLGTLLYALLTGRAPFSGSSAVEILRHVIDDEPPRPRDRNPRVDRDLEIICLKCLRKEAKDRYPSARELADDLNRWLDGRPIVARPASRVERAVKWVRRHRLTAALSGAAAIGAILGVSGLAWGLSAAVAARDEALKGEDIARRHAYAASLNMAERDWRDANLAQVLRRLDETRPPEGKSDLRGFEWYYLDRLARAQGLTLRGHKEPIWSVAYSPDGRRIASASADKAITLWDAGTGALIRTMDAKHSVYAIAFHPDGTRLASAGYDRAVTLWDVATGQVIRTSPGHTREIFELAFSPDGKVLASSGLDGTVRLWDSNDGSLLRTLADHRVGTPSRMEFYSELAFSPDGKVLASAGGGEESIRTWEVATGRRLAVIADDGLHPGAGLPGEHPASGDLRKPVAFSPDGKILASGGADGRIRLRDPATGRLDYVLRDPHNLDAVTGLAFSPDSKRLASISYTGQAVTLWDVATGDLLRTVKVNTRGILDIAFGPDRVHLAAACPDGSVRVLDVTRDQEARPLPEDHRPASVAFGPDGSFLATALVDGTIRIREAATGQDVRTLRGHTGEVRSVVIRKDGRRAASGGVDRTVRIWDVATGTAIHTLRGHTDYVDKVDFSPDGKVLASASGDRTIKLWDADTGREIRTLRGHIEPVVAVAFSPDGQTLASGGQDGFWMLWDVGSGRRLRAIPAEHYGIVALAWRPDGRWLATCGGGMEGTIRVWDVATGREVRTLTGHASLTTGLAFSLDGRRLASSSVDRTVRLWDPDSGLGVQVLRGHSGPVLALAFSPDGARIASAGADQVVRLWEAGLPADRPGDDRGAPPRTPPPD